MTEIGKTEGIKQNNEPAGSDPFDVWIAIAIALAAILLLNPEYRVFGVVTAISIPILLVGNQIMSKIENLENKIDRLNTRIDEFDAEIT